MEAANIKLYDLASNFSAGVGAVTMRELVHYLGSSRAVLEASEEHLKAVTGIGGKMACPKAQGTFSCKRRR